MSNKLHKLKQDFLDEWPLSRLVDMQIEEYTNTNREDSFCYWVEHITRDLGSIVGGSSYKFGIFKKGTDTPTEKTNYRNSDGTYAWHTKYNETTDTAQEAFENIRALIVNIAKYAKDGNLEAIDEIDLGTAYKWKIAFLYSDYNVLNIFKLEALRFIAKNLQILFEKKTAVSIFHKEILKRKGDKDFFEFYNHLWNQYYQGLINVKYEFAEWLNKNIHDSYRNYLGNDEKAIQERLEEINGFFDEIDFFLVNPENIEEHINTIALVLSKIEREKKADFVEYDLKNSNGIPKALLGKNNYIQFLKEKFVYESKEIIMLENLIEEFKEYLVGYADLTIKIYSTNFELFIKNYLSQKNLNHLEEQDYIFFTKVSYSKYERGTFQSFEHKGKGHVHFIEFFETKLENEEKQIINTSINQILYGPPGTGKTYEIINKYITNEIVNEASLTNVYLDKSKHFWHLAPGQSGYLWDELKEQNYLGYEWCDINLGDLSKLTKSEIDSFEIKSRFSKVKKGDYFCIISGKKFFGIAEALHDYDFDRSKEASFNFQTIEVNWICQFEKSELLNTYSTQSFSGLKGGKRWESLVKALANQNIFFLSEKGKEKKAGKQNYTLVSFHQSFAYEDFIEGIKPELNIEEELDTSTSISYTLQDGVFKAACDVAANIAGYNDLEDCINDSKENRAKAYENAAPYFLLIDEINRGNVSAIFGELITLIESDKRLGMSNELLLELPYSKKKFGVPANLHIIGTMNTADRSVEALDTALRRRFEFIEMMPKPELLKDIEFGEGNKKFNLSDLLRTINERIEILLDRDYTIGHSYFINIESNDTIALANAFNNKVIPLLQEYFYGDYGKIGLVLGQGFVTKKENKKVSFTNFEYEGKENLERVVCVLKPVNSKTIIDAIQGVEIEVKEN